MPLVLERSWVGRRVTVRRALLGPDGLPTGLGDVVGDLLGLDDRVALVDGRDGLVEIPVETVVAARIAEPSTAQILALEATCAHGWRAAEVHELDGWLLRADAGFTGRANSALPLKSAKDLTVTLAAAGSFYAERGLPLRIQVPIQARWLLDGELAERGWTTDVDVHVLTARLDQLGADTSGHEVRIDAEPDDVWLAGYHYRGATGLPDAARPLLVRHDRVGFASIRDGGQAVAIARVVVDDDWAGITAVEVAETSRRRGLARAVMAAAQDWAATTHGATRSYLQVESTNEPALELYRRLGYHHHHDYRYRTAPAS